MTENPESTSQFAFKLLLFGISLIFVGMILVIIADVFSERFVDFGGVIFIGPIPIIFGAGENAWLIALVAAVLTMGCLILFFLRGRLKQGDL
jgi:uncharacterized membrane protein